MIIFCGTRNNAEDMSRELNVCFGRGTSRFYHAGMEKTEKEEVEKWFYESLDGILCATCAYGMGVDKKNIKTVVHIVPSATAEAYIQEAGRGGRDGSVAKAILIWSPDDSLKYSIFKAGSRESAMREFAETKDCRRQVLLDALGAEKAVCSGCDLCEAREHAKQQSNEFTDWKLVYKLIKRNPHFYTKEELEASVTELMNRKYIKTMGVNIWNHSDSADLVRQLEESLMIEKSKHFWKGRYSACKLIP